MLVILSDTHHSDGTTFTNPSPESFTLLRETILDRARARHARELRVLLLGDILDLVRTDWWLTVPPEPGPGTAPSTPTPA